MHKDLKSILMPKEEIAAAVSQLADQLNNDFNGEPVLAVVILKGSMFFAADLLRELTMPVTLDFMKVSSYGSGSASSGAVKLALDISADLTGQNVLIIEDIIDSGNTLFKIRNLLSNRGAKCVKICTLLDKPERREAKIEADYTGKFIPNEFVVGYGLDYDERYRNLDYIGILDESVYS